MVKFKHKFIGAIMLGIMSIGTVASIGAVVDTVTVEAASKSFTVVKAKTQHLVNSLHSNYLGIKNQGKWQEYIREIRLLVNKLPSGENQGVNEIIEIVNKAEGLVNSLASINQVEKSLESNSLTMGNVRVWNYYIMVSRSELSRVDKTQFSKEYSKLASRMNKSIKIINNIQSKYTDKEGKIFSKMFTAYEAKDIQGMRQVYEDARKLEECQESDYLEFECMRKLEDLGAIKIPDNNRALMDGYTQLTSSIGNYEFDTTSIEELTNSISIIVGDGIDIKVKKVFENPNFGMKLYEVVLSKGDITLAPIMLDI